MDPQQGCVRRLRLPFCGYIPVEEPRRRPLMLSLGCDILIGGGIRRGQPRVVRPHPAPALLDDHALCGYSTSVRATKRSGTKELLTPLFLRTSLHFVDSTLDAVCDFQDLHSGHLDLFLRQPIKFAQGILDTLISQ